MHFFKINLKDFPGPEEGSAARRTLGAVFQTVPKPSTKTTMVVIPLTHPGEPNTHTHTHTRTRSTNKNQFLIGGNFLLILFCASGEAILGTQRYFSKDFLMFFFSRLRRGDF